MINLPPEILQHILKYVDPIDLARVARSHPFLYRTVAGNALLCKEVYCRALDTPKHSNGVQVIEDYEVALHEYVKVQTILASGLSVEEKIAFLPTVCSVACRLMQTASPTESKNIPIVSDWFNDKRDRNKRDNIESFLCQSSSFDRSRKVASTSPPPMQTRQASAKLHVLYGTPIFCARPRKYEEVYAYAGSMVYDLRNYRTETFWGPYLPDSEATVDWEKMEAVMIVLGYNLRQFVQSAQGIFGQRPIWREPWIGASPNSYIPGTKTLPPFVESDFEMEDPYNISGTWMRVVCFLDFHDLFAYNFPGDEEIDPQVPRGPLATAEAVRLINMELRVVGREEPGENDGKELPVMLFEGSARSMHTQWDPNANSRIRGSVRMTKEGEVRWKSVSVYGGEERWASEGIQVGGVGSARGVLGHWFDKDHELNGPAGPTAFWKMNDSLDPDPSDDSDEETDEDWNETEDPEDVLEAIASMVGSQAANN